MTTKYLGPVPLKIGENICLGCRGYGILPESNISGREHVDCEICHGIGKRVPGRSRGATKEEVDKTREKYYKRRMCL